MNLRTDWVYDRIEAVSTRGMVGAKHPLAAEAGVEVLRDGGNAVDAAVTAAFVAGVVEPFMSGIGGGGFLVCHDAESSDTQVVDFSMVAPRQATPDMFALAGGIDSGMFGWPAVVDDANMFGHLAAAVPGAVAGLSLALEQFGSIPLARALTPAIRYAEEGFPVTWHTTLMIAIDLPLLCRFPASRAIFTDDGNPPNPYPTLRTPLCQPDLARTLRAIASDGPHTFYAGEIAQAIAREMRDHGGLIDEDDLAGYQPRVLPPLRTTYRGWDVATSPTASGGPTVIETLNLLEDTDLAALGHNTPEALHQIAEACRQALADRFAYLADPDLVDVPIDALISKPYAREVRQRFGARARREVTPGLALSPAVNAAPWGAPRMNTTHVSAIDAAGNAASLTTTLLGSWGCGVTVPGTGILLNNGMMWFDPRPGFANSVAGGKRPLANMAPVILFEGDRVRLSLGAMGGRRILNALPQIIANVCDYGLGMQAAISAPRIDCSTGVVQASTRIAAGTLDALTQLGHVVEPIEEDALSFEFGSPVGVLVDGPSLRGGANPYYPAMAIGLD